MRVALNDARWRRPFEPAIEAKPRPAWRRRSPGWQHVGRMTGPATPPVPSPGPLPAPPRRLLPRLALALLPVVLLCGGAELAARRLWSPDAGEVQGYGLPPHPTRLWALPAGASFGEADGEPRIGEDGLRAVTLTGASLRALTLGDSNVFGHDLRDADTLHASLAAALGRRGLQVDVLCGGVPGYSLLQSRILLDEVGWALKPDLLVVANLLSDSAEERFQDEELLADLGRPGRRAADSLLAGSRGLQWLSLRLHPPTNAERNVAWARSPGLLARARVPVPTYRAALDELLATAASHGVSVVLLELATTTQLAGEADAEAWRSAQREAARAAGVPHVRGDQALAAAGLDAASGFLDPVHVNGDGQRAYAEAIAQALATSGWPGSRPAEAGP